MTLAIVATRARVGIHAPAVDVETHISNGLPALSIVGLPEAAVKESKDRVRSALMNAGFEFPTRRMTVNLAPADLPKEGGRFDLAIALGILAASGQIPAGSLKDVEVLGELALDGSLRPVQGVIPALVAARGGGHRLILPRDNAREAGLASREDAFAADHLLSVCAHLTGERPLKPIVPVADSGQRRAGPDLSEVRGQHLPKRALEVAAAGRHNLLMFGPPGTGKSMLAKRLPPLLPALDEDAALAVALVGGGSSPRPGEISLAHEGVLFLDELPEFDRKVLEVLREPMESGEIVISRAAFQVSYPARFQVVAAMNPCPCGYRGHPEIECRCTPAQAARYQARLSGPLLDRFDLHVEVPVQDGRLLLVPGRHEESSATVLERVERARERQRRRGGPNVSLAGQALERACQLDGDSRQLLERAMTRLGLSARALHRILRVARTVADLADSAPVSRHHLVEALGYRKLDRRPGH